ncbi:MAG: AmmeMemoRadiSam system protein A [Verrucomicrobia bacterium]|nr:AmmeMemoRadiSam system protein A [Verrucomicrobiota bacterium]
MQAAFGSTDERAKVAVWVIRAPAPAASAGWCHRTCTPCVRGAARQSRFGGCPPPVAEVTVRAPMVCRAQPWSGNWGGQGVSGETGGDKRAVVGYAAVAFYEPEVVRYTIAERKWLLELARRAVAEAVTANRMPQVAEAEVPARCREVRGCFVTLTKAGSLRGCMGNLDPRGPLYRAVLENARSAALRDPRFPAVGREELGQLELEISVLTEPQALAFSSPEDLLARLRPLEDGVVLQVGERSATYLPQVWEHLPDRVKFLDSLARKAGGEPGDWRGPNVRVLTYTAEVFGEGETR